MNSQREAFEQWLLQYNTEEAYFLKHKSEYNADKDSYYNKKHPDLVDEVLARQYHSFKKGWQAATEQGEPDRCVHGISRPHECDQCADSVETEDAVAWQAFESVADILEPYIVRGPNSKGFLPDSIVESVQMLLEYRLSHPAEQGVGEPVCYMTWHQQMISVDDYRDWVEVAEPGDVSADGTPAFPVYTHPLKPTGGGVPDAWRKSLKELVDAMHNYEMDVEDEPPYKHRAMMDRARSLLAKPTGEGAPTGPIEFAKRMLEASRDGCGVDGADIQDWALECGLIEPYQATESCGEDCICAEVSDFPTECYRDTDLLATQQPPEG